jgi:hypothetical protein
MTLRSASSTRRSCSSVIASTAFGGTNAGWPPSVHLGHLPDEPLEFSTSRGSCSAATAGPSGRIAHYVWRRR